MRLRGIGWVLLVLLAACGAASSQALAAEPQLVRTWSYVGPGGTVSGATIRLVDGTGRVVARGVTTRTGTYTFDLSDRGAVSTPLVVTTSGGTIRGVPFHGHLRARVFGVGVRAPIVQANLISTAASRMATTRRGYDRATRQVRRALRIPRGALPSVLRLNNGSVGYWRLVRRAQRAGGFDALAVRVAAVAASGKRISGLRPVASTLGARTRQSDSTTAMCNAPPVSGPSGSDQLITNTALAGAGALGLRAGIPTAAATGIAGMALGAFGIDTSNPDDVYFKQIEQDLKCISAQLNALTEQMNQLQFTTALATATDCSNALQGTNGYAGYEYLINNATQYPLDSSNVSLTTIYLPAWQQIATTCGAAINNMLFGTAGGQASAWQQLVKNTQNGGAWYGQKQAQALQTFLSYWGMMLYQQFVLTNEVQNYYGAWQAAQAASGYALDAAGTAVQTDSAGTPLCRAGSTPTTSTFCVWTNNITQAYPADLYSDELGLISTGVAANAIPAGIVAPNPFAKTYASGMAAQSTPPYPGGSPRAPQQGSYSPTAMNLGWFYNYFLNFTPYVYASYDYYANSTNKLGIYVGSAVPPVCYQNVVGKCPPAGVTTTPFLANAISYFNGLGVNPEKKGTAQQTWTNPQSTNRRAASCFLDANGIPLPFDELSPLLSSGPGGLTATQALYDTVNQEGTWSGKIAANQILYIDGCQQVLQAQTRQRYLSPGWDSMQIMLTVGGSFGQYANTTLPGIGGDKMTQPGEVPSTPVFVFLTKRPWWPGAARAATYVPPVPPMPS